jgi:hypothetical protein
MTVFIFLHDLLVVDTSFKYSCDNLKWLLIKSFEHSIKIKQVGRVDNIGHIGNTHANCVKFGWGYVQRLHAGPINGDNINYNDKSGEEAPFIILKRFRSFYKLG